MQSAPCVVLLIARSRVLYRGSRRIVCDNWRGSDPKPLPLGAGALLTGMTSPLLRATRTASLWPHGSETPWNQPMVAAKFSASNSRDIRRMKHGTGTINGTVWIRAVDRLVGGKSVCAAYCDNMHGVNPGFPFSISLAAVPKWNAQQPNLCAGWRRVRQLVGASLRLRGCRRPCCRTDGDQRVSFLPTFDRGRGCHAMPTGWRPAIASAYFIHRYYRRSGAGAMI